MKEPSTGTARPTIFIENDRTRVTEWLFPKRGDNTGWHRHSYDFVVVPLFDDALKIETDDRRKTLAEMKHGVPYFRNVRVEHDVISANDFEWAFFEIEFLDKKGN